MKSVFLFFLVYLSGEIVFNEIMYDPDPSIGLPEYEYLELFNRSGSEIDIENWILDAGNRKLIFPKHTMKPEEYLLLVYPGSSLLYTEAADILEIMESKTLLLNQGEILYLTDEEENLIDWIEYSPGMHSEPYYRNGGWSLERLDPDRLCGEEENWGTSKSRAGGTPGRENSIYRENPDYIPPEITDLFVIDSLTLVLLFSETMQAEALQQKTSYNIDNGHLNPVMAEVIGPYNREVILTLDKELKSGRDYILEITGQITDCSGLAMKTRQKYRFALPVRPEEKDLLISEILFDPHPGCPEFVEIYNPSGKTLDLDDIRIAMRDPATGRFISILGVVIRPHLVFPGDYFVFSRDPDVLQQCYYVSKLSALIQVPDLPSFGNKTGNILILDKWLTVIDEFHYSDEMHFPLLNSHKGVSLERLSYSSPSEGVANWHSASSMEGFATPGRENSQSACTASFESAILVNPEVFSPDQDGVDDICFIHYHLDYPGSVINVRIFDPRGRTIKTIAANELAGTEGFFSWDGTDMLGYRARAGIYLILTEVFDLKGRSRKYKRTCVLSPGK